MRTLNAKEFYMKNALRAFGIIAIVAVIGFSFAACGGDDDGGSGGTLTITDIPETYNGKYVRFVGMPASYIIGAKSVNKNGMNVTTTNVQIKNGKVSLPMWVLSSGDISRYSGNHTLTDRKSIGIYDTDVLSLDSGESSSHQVKPINFNSVTFLNGSATLSCKDANNYSNL
jgi:hypothetical protein